jgi:ribose/xylose/arabinose/galactoside ABC-type transport system permease subunit
MKGVKNLIGLGVAWAVVFGVFCLLSRNFATVRNLETLSRQSAIVSVCALGMTYVIISGGIDLSVGSIAAFVSVIIAWALREGQPPLLALLMGLAGGAICGLVNGLLITRLKVGPFIVTLGTLLIVRGAAKGIGHEQKIDAPLTWIKDLLAALPEGRAWQLAPVGVWLTLILAGAMAAGLAYARFGRHVVAVGSNEHAARLCGVPVERVKTWVYVLSGVFAGLAGILLFSRLTVGDPTVAQGMELDVIAAVVIGGASLSGGQGGIAGTLIGALIMSTIRAGGSQMGLPNWVQEIVTGTIIVLAVALDGVRKRKPS